MVRKVLIAVTEEQEDRCRNVSAWFGKNMLNRKTKEGGRILQLLTLYKSIRQMSVKPYHIQIPKLGNKKLKKGMKPKRKEPKIEMAV